MTTKQLELKANTIRQEIIKMLTTAGSGHAAGPLGMADILTALFFGVMKYDPKKPDWPERDRLILSNGHTVPVLYATLAEAGFFDKRSLRACANLAHDCKVTQSGLVCQELKLLLGR